MRAPVLVSLFALALTASGTLRPVASEASPPKHGPALRAAARRVAAAPPVPLLPVQIAGVRAGAGRPYAAMMHAIARDALPTLYACHARLGGAQGNVRGMVHVELSHRENGRWVVAEVVSARRDHTVELCVQRAAERIVVPPSEDDEADAEPVAFDVAFSMPAPRPRR